MIYAESAKDIAPLVVGIVLGIVALIAIIVILYHFVISRQSYKKQVAALDKRYNYLDALLMGQDSQSIRRLETISNCNLLYLDKHDLFSRRFREIFENDDKFADSQIKRCKNLIKNKQFKQLKGPLEEAKKAIDAFEVKLKALDNDLNELIKPEEEARVSIQKLKEAFRAVKQTYYSYSGDLELVSESFNRVFEKLEGTFKLFESHVESAEYEDANALIPTISKVVTSLDKALQELPHLCILATSVVPSKISELSEEYTKIERQGMPLFNLTYQARVDSWYQSLNNIKAQLKGLSTSGAMENLDHIQNEISEVRDLLNKELEDKDYFEMNMEVVYAKVIELEKSFLKLCSSLPKVYSYYKVDEEHRKQVDTLQTTINSAGASKRTLESFVHSSTKQPYSVLKGKLDDLENDYNTANTGLNNFKAYIMSLKTTTEEAHGLLNSYHYRLKQAELILAQIGIESFKEQYKFDMENSYTYLDEIYSLITALPIDVNSVSEKVEALRKTADSLLDDIETKAREQQLAESAIVYSNRDRKQQADVHQQLSLLEKRFYNGDFARVYHEANELFKNKHVEDNSNNG